MTRRVVTYPYMFSKSVRTRIVENCLHKHFGILLLIKFVESQDEGLHSLEPIVVFHRDNLVTVPSSVNREKPDKSYGRSVITTLFPNPLFHIMMYFVNKSNKIRYMFDILHIFVARCVQRAV